MPGTAIVIELPARPGSRPMYFPAYFDVPTALRTPLRLAENGNRLRPPRQSRVAAGHLPPPPGVVVDSLNRAVRPVPVLDIVG